ncbi:MAG: DUF922 domain-containing protein [Hyphomicrobiaceae bacterium]
MSSILLRRLSGLIVLALAGIGLGAGPGVAGPRVAVDYQYYPVNGTTALELMRNLHLHGPTVNGEGAYAVTNSEISQAGQVVTGKGCRIPRYTVGIKFTITLPAAQDLPDASKRVRSAWKSFYAFVRRHEETHKSLWIGCLGTLQAKVRALRASTCDGLAERVAQMLAKEQAACYRKHAAFDRSERSRLKAQPLIQQALRAMKVSGN